VDGTGSVSTDYFQNRTDSFEQSRRRLESPGERARVTGAIARADAVAKEKPPVPGASSITWGTTVKISLAIYFALMGVLVTLAVLSLIALRLAANFAGDQLEEFKVEWETLPSASESSTLR
jgi:hypothetical protein